MSLALTQLIGFAVGVELGPPILYDASGLTKIGTLTSLGGLAEGFDGDTSVAAADCARGTGSTHLYIGVDAGVGNTLTIRKVIFYGPNNNTFTIGDTSAVVGRLRGDTTDTGPTGGTLLGTKSAVNSGSAEVVTMAESDIASPTAFRFNWIDFEIDSAAFGFGVAEVQLFI